MVEKDRKAEQSDTDLAKEMQADREVEQRPAVAPATVQSRPVALSLTRAPSLDYGQAPLRSSIVPVLEPSRKTPVVPPGEFREDGDVSPPVSFAYRLEKKRPADASGHAPDRKARGDDDSAAAG